VSLLDAELDFFLTKQAVENNRISGGLDGLVDRYNVVINYQCKNDDI